MDEPLLNSKGAGPRLMACQMVVSAMIGCVGAGSGLNNSTKVLSSPSEKTRADWSDPAEMEPCLAVRAIGIPKPDGGDVSTTVKDLDSSARKISGTWPTVIFLRGCAGVWTGSYTRSIS